MKILHLKTIMMYVFLFLFQLLLIHDAHYQVLYENLLFLHNNNQSSLFPIYVYTDYEDIISAILLYTFIYNIKLFFFDEHFFYSNL